jgi:glycosyltransferase involved in cell wall biosynthesis
MAKGSEPVERDHRNEARFVVSMASRLVAQKRVDIALRAWAKFLRDVNLAPSDARLVILGDGVLRTQLIEQAVELGIDNSVVFEGFRANPWKYIKRSHAFLSTSEWEGLPCSLIEAQALGVPVVASDCPSGPKEILMGGTAGVLFPRWDVEACAKAIAQIYNDKELARQCVACASINLSRFSVDRIVEEYRCVAADVLR